MDEGNVISIGLDTQTAFYQKHSFYTGQNVQVVSNDYINEYNGLFIAHLIKKQIQKLNWGGTGATLGRLERTKILLPIDKNGEPDYQYMEQYVKNIEYKKLTEYTKRIK